MKALSIDVPLAALIFLCSCLMSPSAHAYLDPGSGSMMLQLLLAGLAGMALGAKMFWRRILAFFRRSKQEPPDNKQSPS